MAAFKVGDKVITSRGYSFDGDVCTVTEVVKTPVHGVYKVSSPSYPGHPGWHVWEAEMTLVPEARNPRADRASHPVNQTVLKHLKRRQSISPAEALTTYSISRLAPAIHDLRAAGHKITTDIRKDARGHRYARYTLKQLAA